MGEDIIKMLEEFTIRVKAEATQKFRSRRKVKSAFDEKEDKKQRKELLEK